MKQPHALLLSTFIYFLTIFYDLISRKLTDIPSTKVTLLDYIQSSIYSSVLFNLLILGLLLFVLILVILTISNISGVFIAYITLLKFMEFIPLLIDIINLLFIHQQDFSKQLNATFFFCLMRLTLSFDFVRRKCKTYLDRQILVIVDLALFISINIILYQYTNRNRLAIIRQFILGLLIWQLNNFYCNQQSWIDFIEWNKSLKGFLCIVPFTTKFVSFYLDITRLMFYTRQICSSLIICLFLWYKTDSIMDYEDRSFPLFLKSLLPNVLFITTILIAMVWDMTCCLNTLDVHGLQRYCLGFSIELACSICYDEKSLSDFNRLISFSCRHANHSVCNQCLLEHVQTAIQNEFHNQIFCPEKDCYVRFDYETVRKILSLTDNNQLIDRYNQYISQQEIEQMPDFIRCSNPLCNVGQINVGGRVNNIVTCYQCHRKTCFIHKIPWHEGKTCQEYDQSIESIEASSRKWILEKSKKCPQCPYYIEKNEGCDHMTCIKCRHEFCWLCLADYQSIRGDGNHRHRPNCKYYAAYNE